MLLPQPRKKSNQADSAPLGTPDQVRQSEEQDQALACRAKREQQEVAVERDRFELKRDKIIFAFELLLAAIVVIAMLVALASDPGLLLTLLLGGGGLGCLAAFFRRRPVRS